MAARRATFSGHNIAAEALRPIHGVRFASPDERVDVAERITDLALGDSVVLTPATYRCPDGSHRPHPRSQRLYTTQTILDAEVRFLKAGRRAGGPRVPTDVVARIAEQDLAGHRRPLSLDQALAVEKIATSGRVLDVLVGPAGTGKSTTMAALKAVW